MWLLINLHLEKPLEPSKVIKKLIIIIDSDNLIKFKGSYKFKNFSD